MLSNIESMTCECESVISSFVVEIPYFCHDLEITLEPGDKVTTFIWTEPACVRKAFMAYAEINGEIAYESHPYATYGHCEYHQWIILGGIQATHDGLKRKNTLKKQKLDRQVENYRKAIYAQNGVT